METFSQVKRDLIPEVGTFELPGFPGGKHMKRILYVCKVNDHPLGNPVFGIKGLFIGVLFLVHGQVVPRHGKRTQVEETVKGLFLAGDWCGTGLPATIESAVRSAEEAVIRIFDK